MSFEEFERAIASGEKAPGGLDAALLGLWYDARGDWTRAHTAAQGDPGPAASWVHAYLHRKEGDQANAAYWYARAGRSMPPERAGFDEEWAAIGRALLRSG